MSWIIWSLYSLVFIYNMIDVWQTKLLLEMGAYEANFLLRMVMVDSQDWVVILVVKLFFLSLLAMALFIKTKEG